MKRTFKNNNSIEEVDQIALPPLQNSRAELKLKKEKGAWL